LPDAVLVKRLAAPEWVFNFGMVFPDEKSTLDSVF